MMHQGGLVALAMDKTVMRLIYFLLPVLLLVYNHRVKRHRKAPSAFAKINSNDSICIIAYFMQHCFIVAFRYRQFCFSWFKYIWTKLDRSSCKQKFCLSVRSGDLSCSLRFFLNKNFLPVVKRKKNSFRFKRKRDQRWFLMVEFRLSNTYSKFSMILTKS